METLLRHCDRLDRPYPERNTFLCVRLSLLLLTIPLMVSTLRSSLATELHVRLCSVRVNVQFGCFRSDLAARPEVSVRPSRDERVGLQPPLRWSASPPFNPHTLNVLGLELILSGEYDSRDWHCRTIAS